MKNLICILLFLSMYSCKNNKEPSYWYMYDHNFDTLIDYRVITLFQDSILIESESGIRSKFSRIKSNKYVAKVLGEVDTVDFVINKDTLNIDHEYVFIKVPKVKYVSGEVWREFYFKYKYSHFRLGRDSSIYENLLMETKFYFQEKNTNQFISDEEIPMDVN